MITLRVLINVIRVHDGVSLYFLKYLRVERNMCAYVCVVVGVWIDIMT